jgi:hypothetical protein
MPLFQKKPRDKKGAAPVAPAWHPNFRNFDRLPDTKTVRTSFFINAGAGFATLGLLIWTGYGEYQLHSLRTETAEQLVRIEQEKPDSDKAIALYGKFQAEEKKLRELEQFTQGGVGGGKLVFSRLLLRLGERLPPRVALNSVEGNFAGIVLRGTVSGSLVEAAEGVGAYRNLLDEDPEIKPQFESILVNNQSPDNATGRLAFELVLKFKEPPKPAPPKEDKK